jgi:lipoprotein signal peptidase
MSDILRIDQPTRRPTAGRSTPPTGRRTIVERDVPIRVHRTADVAPAAARAVAPRTAAALTEPQLAARFFPLACVVAAADLATKAWAVASLAGESVRLGPWLSLSLAFNRGSAGGVWLGENTRALNFTATGIVVGLVIMLVPELAKADRRSWRALALVAGAGLGNMASLLSGRGVPDFLALHLRGAHGGAWVLNVADLALVAGLALLAGTAARLWRSSRAGRAAGSGAPGGPVALR